MTDRVFITRDDTATFICPKCGNTTTADVSKYAYLDKRVRVKCTCSCGQRFEAILEKRKQFRKKTNLPGSYVYHGQKGEMDKGLMTVMDISGNGLKLRLNAARDFRIDDILEVEFHLDDKRRTLIRKKVIVRNVNKNIVGTAFSPHETEDPALGFYLLS